MKYPILGLLGSAILLSAPLNLQATEENNAIVVTASRIAMQENETPFATEIYTANDISNSGVDSLYDFLNQNTSLTSMPSYGNPFTQKLDMRGYGIGDGHQNIVVTLNGQRLNNIDMIPQLLSSIPLGNIERIEIIKGSGAVISGDGAMAGAIHIVTKDTTGISLGAAFGSHGQLSGKFHAGAKADNYAVNVGVETMQYDGFNDADITGKKDEADSTNYGINAKYFPSDALELRLEQRNSTNNIIYPGSLSRADFEENPAQNGGNTYTKQELTSSTTSAGASYDIATNLSLEFDTHIEDKESEYSSGYKSDYEYISHDLLIKHNSNDYKLIAGIQVFDGDRINSDNTTSKVNSAYYAQGILKTNKTNYLFGLRTEEVKYTYQPTSGSSLSDSHNLTAFDIGTNHKYSDATSVFANLQHAYQAPDIDRFFNFGGTFNDFIEPAISNTLNIGINKKSDKSKWKLTAFYTMLENEIYYFSDTFTNTNIDESSKFGLEYQAKYRISNKFSSNINYAYTKATIDSENEGAGSFNGKDLPGVSEHTLNLGLKYQVTDHSGLSLSHIYRSEAYAANDFANNFTQKQPAYNVTSIQYRYTRKSITFFTGIDNLFDNANGIQIRDDAIYPVNFTRTWKIGINARI